MVDLVQVTSPAGVKFTVAKDAADAFGGFISELEGSGYKLSQPESGGYANRNIAGTDTPSQHSFGHAIDVNWQHNPRGANTPSDLPPNVGDIAAAHGLTWGGNWKGDTRDPMHFELNAKPVAVPSNDSLLARMGNIAPAQAPQTATPPQDGTSAAASEKPPSDDALLARMGTIAPPTQPQAAPVGPRVGAAAGGGLASPSEYGDLSAQPWATSDRSPAPYAPVASAVSSVVNALTPPPPRASEPSPNALVPPGDTQLTTAQTEKERALQDTAGKSGSCALEPKEPGLAHLIWSLGAPFAEIGQTALGERPMPTGVNALQMAAPMAGMGDLRFGGPRVPTPPSAADLRAAPLPPEFTTNPLTTEGRAARAASLAPGAEAPSTPTGIPVGRPPPPETPATTAGVAQREPHPAWVGNTVGQIESLVKENAAAGGPQDLSAAATPQQLAAMSPQMAKAYRRMAEVNRVVSPIEGEDTSIKVPGSIPTEAEAKGNPVTSQKEVMTRQRAPEAFEGPQGRLTQNDAARMRLYDDQTLSDPQIETLNENQKAQAEKDRATILAKAGPVDGAPIAATLKGILEDPEIKEQPKILKTVQSIHDALYDADGNLKTDIRSYWGMHRNLMNAMEVAKDPLQASSAEKASFNQIKNAKNVVDGAMDKASGGAFQNFLDNQSSFFQQKNAATILRDFRTKMVNPKTGAIDGNRFHRFVTDLAVRRGKPGIDPAMDIPDETMRNLMDIDDDLKRAGRIDLGKPRGSPTNLYFELAKGLGIAGAHSLASGLGPLGNVGVQVGVGALQRMSANMRLNKLVDQSLNYPPRPDPRITPTPNPPGQFVPPSQRNPLQSP